MDSLLRSELILIYCHQQTDYSLVFPRPGPQPQTLCRRIAPPHTAGFVDLGPLVQLHEVPPPPCHPTTLLINSILTQLLSGSSYEGSGDGTLLLHIDATLRLALLNLKCVSIQILYKLNWIYLTHSSHYPTIKNVLVKFEASSFSLPRLQKSLKSSLTESTRGLGPKYISWLISLRRFTSSRTMQKDPGDYRMERPRRLSSR